MCGGGGEEVSLTKSRKDRFVLCPRVAPRKSLIGIVHLKNKLATVNLIVVGIVFWYPLVYTVHYRWKGLSE